jgi:acetyl esterase/lipase
MFRNTAAALVLFTVSSVIWAADGVQQNVVYGMYSGLALLMDVHAPEQPNGYGLVMIPGSGWEAPLGYGATQLKDSDEVGKVFAIDALTGAGYSIFVINHRSTPRFQYPAPIQDAQRAVRYIRHHAAAFGIDSTRIGAIGGSSGGHLVSLLGTLHGSGDAEDPDPVNHHSAKVQTVVALYPAVDFLAFETSSPWAGGAITSLLGPVNPGWKPSVLQEPVAMELYRNASPITHVTVDDPPFLLIHGDADSVVPFSQSAAFFAELEKTGVPVKLIRMPGGQHGSGLILEDSPDHVGEILAWFGQHLKR